MRNNRNWDRPGSLARRAAALAKVSVYPHLPDAVRRHIAARRLKTLLEFTWEHNPFYRGLWQRHGIERRHLTDFTRFSDLPTVSKDQLRDAGFEDRLSEGARVDAGEVRHTSGSTGRPLSIYTPAAAGVEFLVQARRVHAMNRVGPFDKLAYTGASAFQTGSQLGLFPHVWIGYNDPVEDVAARIEDERPKCLFIYPFLADALVETRGEAWCRSLGLRSVVLNSYSSDAAQRTRLARAFGCHVGDEYSSEEVWIMANTCERGEYHVATDNVWFEIVDAQGRPCPSGRPGRVVVTQLHNRGMPFIRYEQGDIAAFKPGVCGCGRRTQLLERIHGRDNVELRLPSGKRVSTAAVLIALKSARGVRAWQVRQDRPNEVVLRVVPEGARTETNMPSMLDALRAELDASVDVVAEYAPRLDDDRGCAVVRSG